MVIMGIEVAVLLVLLVRMVNVTAILWSRRQHHTCHIVVGAMFQWLR